jgi:hypothetical protein
VCKSEHHSKAGSSRLVRWAAVCGVIAAVCLSVFVPKRALTQEPALSETSSDASIVDLGVQAGLAAALEAGQANGVALGFESGGRSLRWLGWLGAGWASEFTRSWQVGHTELRARAGLGARWVRGRGLFMARLLGGVSVVNEVRTRHQSGRLGGDAGATSTSAWNSFAGVDVEVGAALDIAGGWGLAIFAGPALHFGSPTEQALGWSGRLSVRRVLGDLP